MVARRISKEEVLAHKDDPDTVIIDVRTDRKDADVKIKGAVLETADHVDRWAHDYDMEKTLIFYCSLDKERTSAWTVQKFLDKGYKKVYALEGGWKEWVAADYPVE